MKRIVSRAGRSASDVDSPADERRQYHQAREAFEYAYLMLEPFFDPVTGWQGRSLHHVSFNMLRDNFPHLAQKEIQALLEAVGRVFTERNADLGSVQA